MIRKIISVYKIPLLISATVAIVILALTVTGDPLDIIYVIVGSLLGTFFLDLEYPLYAYIFEPESTFSTDMAQYAKDKDFAGLLSFVQNHKNDIKDKSLNSAIFQIVLAALSIFIAYANTSLFIKSFVLSIYANSIYKLMENYYENTLDDWFWAFKDKPDQKNALPYIVGIVVIFIFCLTVL